jgi:hypothetical protein
MIKFLVTYTKNSRLALGIFGKIDGLVNFINQELKLSFFCVSFSSSSVERKIVKIERKLKPQKQGLNT